MAESPNLAIDHVAASQNQKEVTINDAIDRLDNAYNAFTSIDMTSDVTLTVDAFTSSFLFKLTGTPTATVTLNIPANRRMFGLQNTTGQSVIVQVVGGAGQSYSLYVGQNTVLYCDAADVFVQVASPPTPYDFGAIFLDEPGVSEIFGAVTIAREMVIGDDFASSQGTVSVNPAASYVVDVLFDTVVAGTITVATDGSASFATVGTSVETVVPGTRVEFRAPATTDGTIKGLSVTIRGDLI